MALTRITIFVSHTILLCAGDDGSWKWKEKKNNSCARARASEYTVVTKRNDIQWVYGTHRRSYIVRFRRRNEKSYVCAFINTRTWLRLRCRTSYVVTRTKTEYFYHFQMKYLPAHSITATTIIIIGIVMISYMKQSSFGRVASDIDALHGNSTMVSRIITMCQQL